MAILNQTPASFLMWDIISISSKIGNKAVMSCPFLYSYSENSIILNHKEDIITKSRFIDNTTFDLENSREPTFKELIILIRYLVNMQNIHTISTNQ